MQSQVQKVKKLSEILLLSKELKRFTQMTRQFLNECHTMETSQFVKSKYYQQLEKQFNRLQIPLFRQIMSQMQNPHKILALPIIIDPKYTFFFVIIPKGLIFDWHDHPEMVGNTKCAFGKLKITSIDINHLHSQPNTSPNQEECFMHPIDKLRIEFLNHNDRLNVSTVYPNNYNIHKIEALQLSAFFDLLIPDYPENKCGYFQTIEESEGNLQIRRIKQPQEKIIGFTEYIVQIKEMKKEVENIILIGNNAQKVQ